MRRAAVLLLLACPVFAQPTAGRLPNGSAILPNGQPITPAGHQVELDTLPMALAASPDGGTLYALNGGFRPPSISVVDVASRHEVSRTPVEDAWLGFALDRKGETLWVSGGARASVREVKVRGSKIELAREFAAVPVESRRPTDFAGDVVLSADERFVYVANLFSDRVTALNTQTGIAVESFRTGGRPYRMRLGQRGETMWISHWGDSTVGLYSLPDGRRIDTLRVGGQPSGLLLVEGRIEPEDGGGAQPVITARLFVACANTNSVWVFGLTSRNRPILLERIPVSVSPMAPAGSMPTALELGDGGKTLYIVLAGVNAVLVADISEVRTRLRGAVPTGWLPTAAAALPGGGLAYLNGKGGGSLPAPRGPNPARPGQQEQYVPSMQKGSLGVLPEIPDGLLAAFTERYIENLLYDDGLLEDAGIPPGNPVPNGPGGSSPIEHVIYVIKENRTYDQFFGNLEEGRGEAALTVFGGRIAPNHRRLARRFVLFDNFYAAGDTSLDGWSWSSGAMTTDFLERLWPSFLAGRLQIDLFAAREPAAEPAAGTLWSNAADKGLAVRTYGVPAPAGNPAPPYAHPRATGFDLGTPDGRRVDLFLEDFGRMEAGGDLPSLMVLRLPNDHTAGTAPGFPTPAAMIAEHDSALGRLVEAVSQTRAWAKTAIFIVEDDAQDGADHVDSHRTIALVASPYARRGAVDRTFYSTASVLRTIELILGLRPMTQFDAAATPMWRAFQAEPDAEPYESVRPAHPFDEMNPGSGGQPPRRASAPAFVASR